MQNDLPRKLIPVHELWEIPTGMTEEETRDFWDTHQITAELWDRLEPAPEGPWVRVLPPKVLGAFEEADDATDG